MNKLKKILINEYWKFKNSLRKRENRNTCPRCGKRGFDHGFEPYMSYYCEDCNLWNNKDGNRVE